MTTTNETREATTHAEACKLFLDALLHLDLTIATHFLLHEEEPHPRHAVNRISTVLIHAIEIQNMRVACLVGQVPEHAWMLDACNQVHEAFGDPCDDERMPDAVASALWAVYTAPIPETPEQPKRDPVEPLDSRPCESPSET